MKWEKPNINISHYLKESQSPLGKIIQLAENINQLQKQLTLELDSQFSGHFWVGSYKNGILNLLVDSSMLATRLRFSIPDIRDTLRKQPKWSGLKSIEIKLMVELPMS